MRRSITLFSAAAVAFTGLLVPALTTPAQAAPLPCPPASLWFNTPPYVAGERAGEADLDRRAVDGTLLDRVVLTRGYQDIAFNSAGTKLYGVRTPAGGAGPVIYELDPSTGAELSAQPTSGVTGAGINGLTAAADGSLLLGNLSREIFKVNPDTGVATPFAQFPTGMRSAGEFPQLPDGDILAVGQPVVGNVATFFRLKADGTMVPAGTSVHGNVYSTTLSGGRVFFSARSAGLQRIDGDIPAGPSTAPLPSTKIADTEIDYYIGGTSVQEAGVCNVDSDQSYTVVKTAASAGPVDEGSRLRYTVTVQNAGERDYADGLAGFEDDLTGVVDDGAVDVDSIEASTGTATLTGETLRWVGPLPAEGSGSTVTVTYEVVVDAPSGGDLSLVNTVTATGAGGGCGKGGCATTTAVNATPIDSDGDGLTDAKEAALGTDPHDRDSDDDGLTDRVEVEGPGRCTAPAGTNPLRADTDGDRLADGREVRGLNVRQTYYNNRGVPRNGKRIGLVRTNPCAKDTDRDGLTDWREVTGNKVTATMVRSEQDGAAYYVRTRKTNPLRKDTDRDGLTDRQEVTGSANKRHSGRKTDPTRADSDWGGVLDGGEVRHRTDPSRFG